MNELQCYLVKKGAEKLTIEAIKELIINDCTLSEGIKEFWIGCLNGYAIASDINDIYKALFGGKL